jgi:amino acid transporter
MSVQSQSAATVGQHTGVMVAETELHAGALSFPQVIAQALTHIAPGIALLLAGTFIAAQVGYNMPLAYLFGAVICLAIAVTLATLAGEFPAAASYFTYVSKTLNPRMGFIIGWLYMLYDPITAVVCATIFGAVLESTLQSRWGIDFPWWLTTAIMIGAATLITWNGIKISGRILLALALIELAVLAAFGLSGLLSPGPGGFTAQAFTSIDPKYGLNGLAFGVALVIMAFTGFEAAVPIGEESRNPRKYVPWAVVGSIVIASLFLVLASFGIVNGFGLNNFDSGFAGQPVGAFFTLAERLWGPGWIILLIVLGNSCFGGVLACSIVTNRLLFGYARAGVLPRWLAKVDNHVPRNAIIATTVISVVWGFGVGLWIGGDNAYFWTATILTWAVIIIYGAGAVGVFWYWWRVKRDQFNWFVHFLIPVFAVAALALSFWLAIPSLTGIFFWTLPINIAWIVVGIGILLYFRATKREDWLLKSVEFAIEHEATVEELAMLEKEP